MMSALALMDEPSVQQELKMSQDQITKATETRKKQEEASRGLRELSREEQARQEAGVGQGRRQAGRGYPQARSGQTPPTNSLATAPFAGLRG